MMNRLSRALGFAEADHEHAAIAFEMSRMERRQLETEILLRELEAKVAVLNIEQDGPTDERA